MLEINSSECIGVDQFSGVLDTPTLSDTQKLINTLKDYFLINRNDKNTDIENLFLNGNLPSFQVGDLVTGINLPENIDIVYCKYALLNIFNNGYQTNKESGEHAVLSAIANIVRVLNRGGILVLVEPVNNLIDFHLFLTQSGLNYSHICRVHRRKITGAKRSSVLVNQDLIYIFLKP